MSVNHIVKYAASLMLVIALISCKDNLVIEPEDSIDPGNNENVSFNMVQEQVFSNSCALSGCHAGTLPAAGMNLENGKSYAEIVNVTSKLNPNFKIVNPGSSSESFIIKMLRNTGENTRIMPPAGKLNENLIKLVETWIDEGAKNEN